MSPVRSVACTSCPSSTTWTVATPTRCWCRRCACPCASTGSVVSRLLSGGYHRRRSEDYDREFIETSTDNPARLRTALDLVEYGETGLDGVIKDAMAALPGGDMRNLGPRYRRVFDSIVVITDRRVLDR